jgi:hypothetical protein
VKTALYDVLPADLYGPVRATYYAGMDPLRDKALQRHVYYEEELSDLCNHRDVEKWVTTDDGGDVIGFGMQTRRLDGTVNLVIDYPMLKLRYPDEFAARRLWYVLVMCTAPDYPQRWDVFADLLEKMSWPAAEARGITFLDYCRFNQDVRRMPASTKAFLRRLYGPDFEIAVEDVQTYWRYDFRRINR